MTLAPIVLFVYNRPHHTLKTLESLKNNDLSEQSVLHIYCDGPKKNCTPEDLEQIRLVRKIAREQQWCGTVTVFESDTNDTHPVNLVKRVTEVVSKSGRIIVLEDDLVLGKGFLKYMNDALELYENEEKVMYISGYLPPVLKKNLPETFFVQNFSNWGWGTWKRAWDKFIHDANDIVALINSPEQIRRFNMDGSINHYILLTKCAEGPWKYWDVRWFGTVVANNGLILHPKKSLVRNIGHDKSGMHCDDDFLLKHQPIINYVSVNKVPLKENMSARRSIKNLFLYLYDYSFFSVNNAKGMFRKIIPASVFNYLKKKKNLYLLKRSTKNDFAMTMAFDTAPFNCDSYMEKEFLRLRNQYQIKNVIETGTYKGVTTNWFARNFENVYSIEIMRQYYEEASLNLKSHNNVTLLNSDSRRALPSVLDKVKGNTLIFIDSHWYENPLLPELEIIAESGLKPYICIHDMRNPEDPTMGFDTYPDQGIVYEFSWLKPHLDVIYGENQYEYYFNKLAEGARRGALFCIPKGKA
jgi:GT2 family glycosyltransferase